MNQEPQEKSFLDVLKEHVTSGKAHLPPFDKTGVIIQQEMAKPEPDMQIIEKQILRDPSLTGQLLKAANSPFYRGMQEVTTVRNAIVRLGLTEVANLVTMLAAKKTFTSKDEFTATQMSDLWLHSVSCALGAKWIVRECRMPSRMSEAFFAGLLHDIGKVFLLTAIADLRQSGQISDTVPHSFLEEALASLHAPLGAQLLKIWNIPEIYCTVTRLHHTEDFEDQDVLLPVVSLANKVLVKNGIGTAPIPDMDLATSPEAILLDLSEIKIAELEITVEDFVAFTKEMG